MLVLIWLCDLMTQLWVIRACSDLTMWLCDAVMSHTCLFWFDYVTAWCSYEWYVLVLIWLCDCIMQLWVIRACSDLTMWLHDAVMSHTCLVLIWLCDGMMQLWVIHACSDLTMWLCDVVMSDTCLSWFDYVTACCSLIWVIRACPDLTMWLRDAVMSHTCLFWFDYVTAWCIYESCMLVLIWLCDCLMQLLVIRACSHLTMWLRDAVMSHTFLSWFDYVTAWCSYESYVPVLIWLFDCVMQLSVIRACPDLTMWLHDAVNESYVLVLIWLCNCVIQLWVIRACPDLTMIVTACCSYESSCLSWFDYATWWCSYESYVLVLIWLCDCVIQLWVICACPDLTMWLHDSVMSHTCLSWFDYVTAWCKSHLGNNVSCSTSTKDSLTTFLVLTFFCPGRGTLPNQMLSMQCHTRKW